MFSLLSLFNVNYNDLNRWVLSCDLKTEMGWHSRSFSGRWFHNKDATLNYHYAQQTNVGLLLFSFDKNKEVLVCM